MVDSNTLELPDCQANEIKPNNIVFIHVDLKYTFSFYEYILLISH